MSLANAPLPTDPDDLRTFAELLQAEVHAKTLHIEKLKAQLAALRRARFGRSSEALDREIRQLELLLGAPADDGAERPMAAAKGGDDKPAASGRAERKPGGRQPLPAHLPRETVVHEPACTCPVCGSARLTRIGEDRREVLEYVPSYFKVIVHVRPKVSCRACETITQEPMPSLPIERGRPGPALLAHVLVAKYCDHSPLNRQSGIYRRAGVDIDRGTMVGWVGQFAFLAEPVWQGIARHVRAGPALHADDTPVPVLDPGRGRTKTGRLWVLVRDERPWGSTAPPAVVYRYSPDRKGEHAKVLLDGCRGFLHADAYAGFNDLYAPHPATGQPIIEPVACWSHARRQIYEVHADTASPLAQEALERMAQLFAIEATINGNTPDVRLAVRQKQSVPLLAGLKAFLDDALTRISAKSTLAKAIRYALVRWTALVRYTTDGRLEMTNNAAERAIRPLALGRKNWLFAGADSGGERAAMMYTIIQTAVLNGLDPEAYLRDLAARIADHPINRIDELLPWEWARRNGQHDKVAA
ncbi:IS66 family transposase [Telmatospirillum sp.]|uniref:IS66 family transposase n=1 Tax=Telmatospirillum sp. TaxID=2079197 RepID=UPI00283DB00E|nr:IS66 family transposase [Telmatospirillum sp.]MDR3436319.1 IS66 family transposase [Telmatospirillum sp.]